MHVIVHFLRKVDGRDRYSRWQPLVQFDIDCGQFSQVARQSEQFMWAAQNTAESFYKAINGRESDIKVEQLE